MAVLKYWDETLSQWLPVAPGPKGDKGDKGDTGDLANLDIGTVTTGSPAAAHIDGNFEDGYELDLTLPAVEDSTITVHSLVPGATGVFDIRSYGAVGDGTTDDRAAIQAAIDAAQAVQGEVLVPDGVYVVGKSPAGAWALTATSQVTISGSGTLKLADYQPNFTSLLHIAGDDVTIRGLRIDGNAANQDPAVNLQRHGILALGDAVTADRCTIVDCAGDAVQAVNNTGTRVTDCTMTGHQRNGVTLYATGYGVCSGVLVSGCVISCLAQPIDCEPEPESYVTDATIVSNQLTSTGGDFAVAVQADRMTVAHNIMTGAVWVFLSNDITLTGNVIDSSASAHIPLTSQGATARVTVSGNTIVGPDATRSIEIGPYAGGVPQHWAIEGNTIRSAGAVNIIWAQSVDDLVVSGNRIDGEGVGVTVMSVGTDSTSAVVLGNTITGCDYGIYCEAGSGRTLPRLLISGNVISRDSGGSYGIKLVGSSSQLPLAVVSDNIVGSTYSSKVDMAADVLRHGFFGVAPGVSPTITGSRGGNAALASLLTKLAALGLITDSTTAS